MNHRAGRDPVNAKKYYLKKRERGEWRIFNPANPYSESTNIQAQDLKVESLDDLFADEEPASKNTQEKVTTSNTNNNAFSNIESIPKKEAKPMEIPLEDNNEEVNNIDLEKALEAKFDELFGADDD